MDWNLNASSEWGWEIEIPKSLAISNNEEDGGYSFSGVLDSSYSDMMEESAVLSGEAMIGLKLGRRTKSRTTSVPDSSVKRSRASHQSFVLPRCQIEGCNLDLSSAKDYHRRHRICVDHTKSPKVVVAGMERRFCQQCSRLHDLSEFDDRKRSCRRRLSAHNARRRRPQQESTKLNSTYQRSHDMGFLVSRVSILSPNSTPQTSSNFKGKCAADIMSNEVLSISSSFHGIAPRRVNHDGLEANSSSINAMEVHRYFSLEAGSSWGFKGHEEPSSFDQFIHGRNIGLMQPWMPLEMQSTCNTQISHDSDCFCSD